MAQCAGFRAGRRRARGTTPRMETMKAIYKACALAALGLACSVPAMAGEYYIGGSFGRTHLDADTPAGYTGGDRADTGYKLYAGMKLSTDLGVEVSYWDLGSAERRRGTAVERISSSAFGVGLAYKPVIVDKLFGIGRAGLARVKAKYDSDLIGSGSDDNMRAYFALGLGYSVLPQLDVQATWDFMQTDYQGQGRRVDLFSVGMSYAF
ncbi:MAG: hypothetical protein EPO01_06060 [Aquabacterium sp.]|nr:MAG: hypothetical protein EPO01_06060 [Aquabacterium sp.]